MINVVRAVNGGRWPAFPLGDRKYVRPTAFNRISRAVRAELPSTRDILRDIYQPRRETGPIGEPAKNADGVFFGYLEKRGREFVAVRARYLGALVNLDNPVRLDPPRHTDGKKFGPHSSKFGDESARNLLCDMIDSNPSQAGELTRIGTESGLL